MTTTEKLFLLARMESDARRMLMQALAAGGSDLSAALTHMLYYLQRAEKFADPIATIV